MKLLSLKQVNDTRATEVARDILRTQEIQEVADKTRKSLANAQADFSNTLASHKERWAKEEEKYKERKVKMEREIDILEKRKTQALIPISMYQKEADEKMKEAHNFLLEAKKKEE